MTSKPRNSNIELYRIIVMLSIVMHHYVVNSGLMQYMVDEPTNPKSVFLFIVGMWGKTGINCFVLITGYFMCKSQITLRKFLKLLLEIEFYNITIHLLFVASGYVDFSVTRFLWLLFPIQGISHGFVSCYIAFFLFIPFMNVLVINMNRHQHQLLVVLCLGVYTVLNFIPGLTVEMNYVTWFCVLFFIGSYLRIYPYHDGNKHFWKLSLLISLLLAVGSVVMLLWLTKYGCRFGAYAFVSDSNAPLAVLVSICAFMYFKSLTIKQSKFINTVGGGTFAILIIHANSDIMRQWLWRDLCNNAGHYVSNAIYFHALAIPVMVFFICSAIEFVRAKTIEQPLIDFTYNWICKGVSTIKEKNYGQRS